jgi:outer membrane receptor protein involved in Fe transport
MNTNQTQPCRAPARTLRSAVAVAIALAAQAAAGQQTAGEIEEIVVTAQKRPEGVQEVPIAISAFSADSLDRALIWGSQDLQFSVPNTMLVGNDRFTIRGIGNNAISSTADNGVASFINGSAIGWVPQNEFYDLDRIEVMRGPQGTLYGRNTTGGAINVVTARPQDDLGGNLYLEAGNYNTMRWRGALNLPVSDNIKQRFAGYILQRDGYTENVYKHTDIDDRDQWSVRSSTLLTFGDSTEADLVLQYYKENSSRVREAKRLCKPNPALGCSPEELGYDNPVASATLFSTLFNFTSPAARPGPFPIGDFYKNAPNPRDLRKVAADTDPYYSADQFFGTLDISHKFGSYTFESVTAFADGETEANIDYDNSALPFRFTAPATYYRKRDTTVTTDRLLTTDSFTASGSTWTQEFRLLSSYGGKFDFIAGAFGLWSDGESAYEIWHPSIEFFMKQRNRPQEAWHFSVQTPEAKTDAWALFGETYYRFTDATTLTVGARYTDEEKSIRTRTVLPIFTPTIPDYATGERSWGQWTGKIALDHLADLGVTDSTLFYGSLSSGYKGGGLNPGNSDSPDFKPETLNALEIGMKNTLLDRSMQANFAAFYYDYADLQLAQRISGTAITTNADATVWGLEAELAWAPTDRWLFELNLAYLSTEIGDFVTVDSANPAQSLTKTTPVVPVNLDGNELPYSPPFSVKFALQYTQPLATTGWDAMFRLDTYYQDQYYAREFNTPNDTIDSWSVTDLQVRFMEPGEQFSIQLYVKNLTDEDNITNSIVEGAEVGRYRNVRILDPMTWGAALEFRF